MGWSSGGRKKLHHVSWTTRNRQRANISFFIVVMFFAVFGIIIFTEVFFIDDRSQNSVLVRHGSLSYRRSDRDYDDPLQSDDYISIKVGGSSSALSDAVNSILRNEYVPANLPFVADERESIRHQIVMETQLPPYPNGTIALDGKWQAVNGTRNKFYVFSAFFDHRKGQRAVRVIAATRTRSSERVWCRLWYRLTEANTTTYISRTVPAKLKVIRENWNLKYSACFILCPLQTNQTAPASISIVAKVLYPPANVLIVNNNYNETRTARGFGICVKPLHYVYNRALQILEFIEFNRLLGITHFTFYNHTIGPQVNCILADYIERGIVTLLPWQLNIPSQKEIRTEGLFAALNDCLYRSMYRFSHILLIDLDEFIIPRYNDTLPQLIEHLGTKMSTRTTASFSFQNSFFYLQWGNDEWVYRSVDPLATSLVTLKKTRRKTKLHPHKQRSKYICRPELVVEAGNHFVWEFIPGHGTYNVPADAAILHHYRICEFGGDDCIKAASTVDTTALRFRDQLVSSVSNSYEGFSDKCKLNDLPPPPTKTNFFSIFNNNFNKFRGITLR